MTPYDSRPVSSMQGQTPVQKAIQTLSLRMPRGAGGGQPGGWPYPPEFYGAQAGGPGGNAPLLELIRRMLFGGAPPMGPQIGGAPSGVGAPSMPSAPGMPPGPMGGRFGTQPLPRSPAMPPAAPQGPPDQILNPSAPPAGNIDDLILSLFGPR